MNLLGPSMEQIAEVIVRPSRHLYKVSDLGPKAFLLDGLPVTRTDFQTHNKRGLIIRGSFYSKQSEPKHDNVLAYLHCNSGCRVEALAYLRVALEHDFHYLTFDFTGSGLSQGRYVSLGMYGGVGFHQADDLQTVIKYVKKNIIEDAKFTLWGRSMGAVTALRFLALYKENIRAAVFDSPFQSLKRLFLQIGKQRTGLPQLLLGVAYKYLKPVIFQKGGFDIDQVDLEPLAPLITTPGIFLASKQDALIPFQQIQHLFGNYGGQKQMFFIEESHNQARDLAVIRKVFKTLRKMLLVGQQLQLRKQKTSFYSILPGKDPSKKKLELTIKSLSQRQLKSKQPFDHRPKELQLDFGLLEKKKTSCLFPKKERKASQAFQIQASQSFLETKRKPLAPKHFLSENAPVEEKGKPKFAGQPRVIEIKMKAKDKDRLGKSRERKTFQHISSKRPPFVELKGVKQLRNSFELRYRT